MAKPRERVDECPNCGDIAREGWVLGHHYCPKCDHTFNDSGRIVEEDGRYI